MDENIYIVSRENIAEVLGMFLVNFEILEDVSINEVVSQYQDFATYREDEEGWEFSEKIVQEFFQEMVSKVIDSALQSLLKQNIVTVGFGEDDFVFSLTEEGKKIADELAND